MSPIVAYLMAVGGALIFAVILVELGEAHDRERRAAEWDEMERWQRARQVTSLKRWE
jgi:uncharacterized membrane protein